MRFAHASSKLAETHVKSFAWLINLIVTRQSGCAKRGVSKRGVSKCSFDPIGGPFKKNWRFWRFPKGARELFSKTDGTELAVLTVLTVLTVLKVPEKNELFFEKNQQMWKLTVLTVLKVPPHVPYGTRSRALSIFCIRSGADSENQDRSEEGQRGSPRSLPKPPYGQTPRLAHPETMPRICNPKAMSNGRVPAAEGVANKWKSYQVAISCFLIDMKFISKLLKMWELDINGRGRRRVGKNWAIMPGDGPRMPGDDQ